MKAQEIYDIRSHTEFCSGEELVQFFREVTGSPAPSGEVSIAADSFTKFSELCATQMAHNSPKTAKEVQAVALEMAKLSAHRMSNCGEAAMIVANSLEAAIRID